jgi:chorismate synthase
MLRFLTSGESHGTALVSIIEGFPANVPVEPADITRDLKRRMGGYGRGGRMKIESDEIEIFAGVRHGRTLGSPIAFAIHNRDWANWTDIMSPEPNPAGADKRQITRPRPGHADLSGALKYQFDDMRNVLERSSARETASRVAVGAFCKTLLQPLGITVYSHTVAVKDIRISEAQLGQVSAKMIGAIESKGLGSYVHWDRRLDGRLGQAIMSINAVKAVEVGSGLELDPYGSEYHDEILYDVEAREFRRKTNHAGGIEGGMTNGEEIIVRGVLKPIPTLKRPLMSVDMRTKEPFRAQYERSDTCVVPAAGVIGEAMVAIVLVQAIQEKLGGDTLEEMSTNLNHFKESIKQL